jgi:hypothetical protein
MSSRVFVILVVASVTACGDDHQARTVDGDAAVSDAADDADARDDLDEPAPDAGDAHDDVEVGDATDATDASDATEGDAPRDGESDVPVETTSDADAADAADADTDDADDTVDAGPSCLVDGQSRPFGATDPDDPCQVCDPFRAPDHFVDAVDGLNCPGGACVSGACVEGCLIDDLVVPGGEVHDDLACFTCDPLRNPFAWSVADDGTPCATGVCRAGECVVACVIDGAVVADGAAHPDDVCRRCEVATDDAAWSPAPDGAACGSGSVCVTGECTPGCWTADRYWAHGEATPFGGCQVCEPGRTDLLTNRPAGTACGDGGVCLFGGCANACIIDGQTFVAGQLDPEAPCATCDPTRATSAWSAVADGAACDVGKLCLDGACTAACFIGSVRYAAGDVAPDNACLVCNPAIATTAWSPRPAGESCGAGRVCSAGACFEGCVIDGALRLAGALEPGNSCRACLTTTSTSLWSARPDGTACGGLGPTCVGGECDAVCIIDGATFDAGDRDPDNPCRRCSPELSISAWSNLADGAGCGEGAFCEAGACVDGCLVDGAVFTPGEHREGEACRACEPATSTTAFTLEADGSPCDGGICVRGTCSGACFIEGVLHAAGGPVGDPCRTCEPDVSQTEPVIAADGTTCGGDRLCVDGTCVGGCWIDGVHVAEGAIDPANPCRACRPHRSATAWSRRDDGAECPSGACSDGACVGAPRVTYVEPACVPVGTTPELTVEGAGFFAGATVTFDTTAATAVTVRSANKLAVTPPTIFGQRVADVSVKNVVGAAATREHAVFFHLPFDFGAPETLETERAATATAIGDVDSDGDGDLVIGTTTGIRVHRLLPSGALDAGTLADGLGLDDRVGGVAVDRVDGDGLADVVRVAFNGVQVFPGRADGSFGAPIASPGSSWGWAVHPHFDDVDGDARTDIVAAINGAVVAWIANGDGTFDVIESPVGARYPYDEDVADVDADGVLDPRRGRSLVPEVLRVPR